MTDRQFDRLLAVLESIAATLRAMQDAPEPEPIVVKHEWPWPARFFGGGMFG
jgi:hypothetical protein